MKSLELRVPPLMVFAVFATLDVAIGFALPQFDLPFGGHRFVALALLVLGVAIAIAGVLAFRRARTSVDPLTPTKATSIVATGVYSVSRNPMYLGMALALLGVAVWVSSVPGYLLVPVFCLYITRFQIQPEERALVAAFGEPFLAYMGEVRRWV